MLIVLFFLLILTKDNLVINNEDVLGFFKIKYVPKQSKEYTSCLVPFILYKSKVPKQ